MTKYTVFGYSYSEICDEDFAGHHMAYTVEPRRGDTKARFNLLRPSYEEMATRGVVAIFPASVKNKAQAERALKLANEFCEFMNRREEAVQAAFATVKL